MFAAWHEFKKGKTSKADVIFFEKIYREELSLLHQELRDGYYEHAFYSEFYIQDPKLRKINKACVRDRILHHAVFRKLYPIFDRTFIFDSYSCRLGKGTHRAVRRLDAFFKKASQNNTKLCYVLKCDIKKFFNSINHDILISLMKKKIADKHALWLIGSIINSYSISEKTGIPMGNITSQIFANIYLNTFDQFAKHHLRATYYIRYCDDFLILSDNKKDLELMIPKINHFLHSELKLHLHPDKVFIKTLASGMDFLGWVNFYSHRVLRTKTKNRMFKKLSRSPKKESLNSYLGLISHGNSYKIKKKIFNALESKYYET